MSFSPRRLESLQNKRKLRRFCLFCEIYKDQALRVIKNLPSSYSVTAPAEIPKSKAKHGFLKNSFLPSAIIEWNNVDLSLRSEPSLSAFKQNILQFIWVGPIKVRFIMSIRLAV